MIRRLLSGLAILWALGFVLFASTLPAPGGDERTDGIVVVTGGPGRVRRGLTLLQRGLARRMLISGVDRRVRPAELATTYGIAPGVFARVDLGHQAVDTRSNAEETSAWAQASDYRSIRLVTTDWHMRRARLELDRVLGRRVHIVEDAVRSEPALGTLVREYDKYLLRLGASLAGR